jgi:hypothetical protein
MFAQEVPRNPAWRGLGLDDSYFWQGKQAVAFLKKSSAKNF